jgi:ABC-2 type transport system ATP-binding protein
LTPVPEGSPSDKTKGQPAVALAFDKVSKAFVAGRRRVQALRQVSLEVHQGVVTGLIGPDAAGKTTLMRLACGLLEPDEGRIAVLGTDVVAGPLSVQAGVGYMPQRFGLYEDLSVQENLDLYADLQGVPHAERPGRYQELMRMTGLGPFTSRLAGRLSGGMKQKLGLACTLVRAPRLLLLDEPTVGVDPVSRRELWNIVYRLVREESMTVLLSTAYLDEAERCSEVILMHEGGTLGYGPPEAFSAPLAGRTFALRAANANKREVQEALAAAPGVLDAVIQGERVRIVMAESTAPPTGAAAGVDDAEPEPVPPRFEDGFIATLRSRPGDASTRASFDLAERAGSAARNEAGPVIEVQRLQRRFGDFYAVKDISFDVSAGEVFGLLGANGAGKSTTFRMLCGLLPPSAGHLQVAGVDLRHAAATARARIGYMSQKFSLYGNLGVLENLEFFGSAYGLWGKRRSARIQWALDQFELRPVADVGSGDLSLGYKQRLAMACSLMHEPDILFLDEPTSGVDPLARREFWARINRLAQSGVTVLVTTHFMEEAEYCDRLAIMAAGQILALGTPEEVKGRVRSEAHPEPTMEDAFIALIEAQEGTR